MNSVPVKVIPANDVVGALLALGEALEGKCCVYISPREINGVGPEVTGIPETVSNTALIIESSGSTGSPKKIYLSKEALIASAKATEKYFGFSGQWVLALPINYIAGAMVLVRSLLADTQPVLMNTAVSFTPEAFALSSSMVSGEHKFVSVVPTQLVRIKQLAETDEFLLLLLKRYDAILVGGQSVSAEVLSFFAEHDVNVVSTYGMAETSGGCVYNGEALDGVDVQIFDGQIGISGPMLANDVADQSGYFMSHDVGEFVGSRLSVLGRSDRVLISGGLKIGLDQVEAVAGSVPGVVEVGATALDSAEWGQRVGIVYVGSPEVADYVAGAVFEQLGIAAKPIRVIRVDRLPRLSNGKADLITLNQLFDEED